MKVRWLAICALSLMPIGANAQRYFASPDGSEVADQKTGLIWRRCAEGMSFSGGACTGTATSFSYKDALQQAKTQAGRTGVAWRLPTIRELLSLVEIHPPILPAINVKAFPTTPSGSFWSGSTYSDDSFVLGDHGDNMLQNALRTTAVISQNGSTIVWVGNFVLGNIQFHTEGDKGSSDAYHVRLVRSAAGAEGASQDLIEASRRGDTATVQAQLAKGADINSKSRIDNDESALLVASRQDHLQVVQALLAKGANVNEKGNFGETALMWASMNGYFEVSQALLAMGADVNSKANNGKDALDMAKAFQKDDILALLTPSAAQNLTAAGAAPVEKDSALPIQPTAQPTTHKSRFVYVANSQSNNISGYTIDDETGSLKSITGSPFAAGTGPSCISVDPKVHFVYAVSGNGLIGYKIDGATGELTPLHGSPFAADFSECVALDPSGKFAFVTKTGGSISTFAVRATSGALSAIAESHGAEDYPHSLAVTPGGKYLYVAVNPGKHVLGYRINAATGYLALVPGAPFAAGSGPQSISVDPAGRFVYVANLGSGDISGYAINAVNGSLTKVPGSPFHAGHGPFSVTVDPTGRFAYAAAGPNVFGYSINSATGELADVPGSPFIVGDVPTSVAVDPAGNFVYVTISNSNLIVGFRINRANGALTLIPGTPFQTGSSPTFVAIAPGS